MTILHEAVLRNVGTLAMSEHEGQTPKQLRLQILTPKDPSYQREKCFQFSAIDNQILNHTHSSKEILF